MGKILNPTESPAWDMTFEKNPETELFSAGTIQGMTLRDYFAAKAMQGLLDRENLRYGMENYTIISRHAYCCADEMLKEREK